MDKTLYDISNSNYKSLIGKEYRGFKGTDSGRIIKNVFIGEDEGEDWVCQHMYLEFEDGSETILYGYDVISLLIDFLERV